VIVLSAIRKGTFAIPQTGFKTDILLCSMVGNKAGIFSIPQINVQAQVLPLTLRKSNPNTFSIELVGFDAGVLPIDLKSLIILRYDIYRTINFNNSIDIEIEF
jgi:hypothetical protein